MGGSIVVAFLLQQGVKAIATERHITNKEVEKQILTGEPPEKSKTAFLFANYSCSECHEVTLLLNVTIVCSLPYSRRLHKPRLVPFARSSSTMSP